MSQELMRMALEIRDLLEAVPEARAVMEHLRAGRMTPEAAMDSLAAILYRTGHGGKLNDAASQYAWEHAHGTPNPLMDALIKERASLDGDVPEARTTPLLEGARPAVPVLTDSTDPVYVGLLLQEASDRVMASLRQAEHEHNILCDRLLESAVRAVPEGSRETALMVARKNLPAPPLGVPGYMAGQPAEMMSVPDVSPLRAAHLTPMERRACLWRSIATTQGRVSLTPVVRDGVVKALADRGMAAYWTEPLAPDLTVVAQWVVEVWGAEDLADEFNPVMTAIQALSSDIYAKLHREKEICIQVTPYHGVSDRRFGWVVAASPCED